MSVGQQLREQRLQLGLQIDEISAKSRIPLRTLNAIESDDLSTLSSPFLYKSFVRQFAGYLQLDIAALAPELDSAVLSMPQPRMPGEDAMGRTNLPPIQIKGRQRNFRWLYSVASLAFVLVACSSLYGVWQTSKYTWWAELERFVHPAKAEQPAKSVVSVDQVMSKAGSPEFRVELSALERTWLSIVEDGRQTFSGVLAPEQTKVLQGHETASIRMENAGGISCVFNGKVIGTLGERGQARTVVFTKTNYEVLDPAPRVALIKFPLYR